MKDEPVFLETVQARTKGGKSFVAIIICKFVVRFFRRIRNATRYCKAGIIEVTESIRASVAESTFGLVQCNAIEIQTHVDEFSTIFRNSSTSSSLILLTIVEFMLEQNCSVCSIVERA